MAIQKARRANPYPWTWEIPLAAALGVLVVLFLAMHLARTLANGFAAGNWALTPRMRLVTATPGLWRGDAGAGLTASASVDVASARTLHTWMWCTELVVVVAMIWVTIWALRRWGPWRVKGMATPTQAEELLGISRLRKSAHIIRPDLHTNGDKS